MFSPNVAKRARLNGGSSERKANVAASLPLNLQEQRRKLPIFGARRRLIEEIKKHPTCIIIGETGSGKSTQIPQFIYEGNINGGEWLIGVTQPRRVAAVSLAHRVAAEVGCNVGETVGYSVRFDRNHSHDTLIHYLTDGMLLREAMKDHFLSRYSVVILDEAHERTLRTDVLFGIVKQAQKIRKKRIAQGVTESRQLKIILMSATMDVDHFSKYFNDAPVFYVEGRQHPVQVYFTETQLSDYVHSALVTVFQINSNPIYKDGDMLVFLTGQDEIEGAVRKCREVNRLLPPLSKVEVFPLYAALPTRQQMRVFEPSKPGHRKVIFATNIAETSLTIPGIKFVVDSGKVKSRFYKAEGKIDMLRVHNVSKAQACQRTGRAGREGPGVCFRLYREAHYDKFDDFTVPEIERCSLTGVVLELVSMNVTNLKKLDLLDRPSDLAIENAVGELELLGAIQRLQNDELKLTDLGKKLVNFPVEPKLARIILAAADLGCTSDILTVVALMSHDSIFVTHSIHKEKSEEAHRKFFRGEGDHLTMLLVMRAFKKVPESDQHQWCLANFVQERNVRMVEQIRNELKDICNKNNVPLKSCGNNFDVIRKALCSGLFMNSAQLDKDGELYSLLDTNIKCGIHPSSVLRGAKPRTFLFSELMLTNQVYCKDLTVVDADWLYEAAPGYCRSKHLMTEMV